MNNPNWTEEEIKMAINIYCKVPFLKTRKTSPEIIKWAKIIGRSPGGLYTKLCNLGHCDKGVQDTGFKGLSHIGKLDEIIWAEFEQDPERIIYESEQLLAQRMNTTIEEYAEIDINSLPEGKTKEVIVRQRINQRFFHEAVLVSYNNQCCITGVNIPSLLEACHISPWKDDVRNRTNPKNGLCMNPFFHRAYDKFLFTISPDYNIIISEQMMNGVKDKLFLTYLKDIQGRSIILPKKFLPDITLLTKHYEQYRRNI